MLHIIDNYYAQTNNYGYTVIRQKTNRKTGEVTCTTLGYVGTLKEVLELVKKDILHNHIKEKDVELSEVLSEFWVLQEKVDMKVSAFSFASSLLIFGYL